MTTTKPPHRMSFYPPALASFELAELRIRLKDRAEDVAIAVLGQPNVRNSREMRWGRRNGSLALATHGPKRGLWCDRATGGGGDILQLLVNANGGWFPAAIEQALALTGYSPPSRIKDLSPEQRQRRDADLAAAQARWDADRDGRDAQRAASKRADDEAAIREACDNWAMTRPLEPDDPGCRYLTARSDAKQPVIPIEASR